MNRGDLVDHDAARGIPDRVTRQVAGCSTPQRHMNFRSEPVDRNATALDHRLGNVAFVRTRIDFIDYEIWGRAEFYGVQWYKDENGLRYFVLRGTSGGVATSNLAYVVCAWNLYPNNPAGISYIDTLTVPSGY